MVWAQVVRSEASAEQGEVSAAIFWDGAKYYEYFDLEVLRDRALKAGVPPVAVKVHMNLWKGPRFFKMGSHYSTEALFAKSGLPAGSSWNNVYVRAYAQAPFDAFVASHPGIQLGSYVDDDGGDCQGSGGCAVPKNLGGRGSVACLLRAGSGRWDCHGQDTIASNLKLAQRIGKGLGQLAGVVDVAAVNLGVDMTIGARRGHRSAGTKRRV